MSKATNAKIRKRVMEMLKKEGEVFVDPLDIAMENLKGFCQKMTPMPTDPAKHDPSSNQPPQP
jgi:hypothetical protein